PGRNGPATALPRCRGIRHTGRCEMRATSGGRVMQGNSERRPMSGVTDRRSFLGGVAAACAAAWPGRSAFAQPAETTRPPNVVLILSDDQAWGDYGFMGHPVIRTPNIDRL